MSRLRVRQLGPNQDGRGSGKRDEGVVRHGSVVVRPRGGKVGTTWTAEEVLRSPARKCGGRCVSIGTTLPMSHTSPRTCVRGYEKDPASLRNLPNPVYISTLMKTALT